MCLPPSFRNMVSMRPGYQVNWAWSPVPGWTGHRETSPSRRPSKLERQRVCLIVLTLGVYLQFFQGENVSLSVCPFKSDTRNEKADLKRSLSLSYQKKDGHRWLHPSFFWYDTDFARI